MVAPSRPSSRRPARAFTLIEVTVVVVIIGLLATLILPRLASTRRQQFDLFTNQVADVLMLFAQRDNLGRRPIGLRIDTRTGTPRLEVVAMNDTASDRDDWAADTSVRPVEIPEFVGIAGLTVIADGEQVDIVDWPLTHLPGENRPAIQIEIRDTSNRTARVMLSPYAVSPTRIGTDAWAGRPTVDLDAEGRSREDW